MTALTMPVTVEQFAQDARYALRALRRSPGFSAVAILTLALGIGVNTAIFSVINAVVLRPLPYRDPAALVLIDTSPVAPAPPWLTMAWRERARGLSGFTGFTTPRSATLVHDGESHQITASNVAWNFFAFLGAPPAIGRDFAAVDAEQGAPAVAVLSHEFWRRAFGGSATIVGRTLIITGSPLTIVGVAPSGFRFPAGAARPSTGMPPETQPDVLLVANPQASLAVIGRLAPGSTPASASGELLAIFKQEGGAHFQASAIERFTVDAGPLQDRLVGNVRQRLWLVMGAVGFVLLVACANVANLLLTRASARQRELALSLALGARRGRVARLLITESLVLALAGSAVALVFAVITGEAARVLLANRLPHVDAITIDATVLAFNVAVAIVTGTLCGVVSLPAVRRISMAAILAGGTPAVTGRTWIRRLLLSSETAVTFVLVVGAGLFAQTLWNLSAQDNGFDADRVLSVRVASPNLPREIDRRDRDARSKFFTQFFSDLRGRMEQIPGVASAGAISLGPLDGVSAGFGNIVVNGRKAEGSFTPVAFVTPGYFMTLRIPVVAGRDFTDSDRLGGELVAIVNETFQRRYVPDGGNIIGARVTSGSGPETFTIVGVTQDVPDRSLRQRPEPVLIAPLAQMPAVHISWSALTFVLRTPEGDPLRLAPELRRTIWAINPNIVINEIVTMEARVAVAMRSEKDSALLFGLFAVAALIMAAIGVYGVAAYAIAQRTKEIGIRLALGATPHDVRRLVVSQTLWPTLLGSTVGVAAAALLTQLVQSMVYGVTPLDPAAFAAGVVILVSVALAATWAPTQRAARINPVVALRYE